MACARCGQLGLRPRGSGPSPGEARKLRIASGIGRGAWALLLDEPTNHLDLSAVERLEHALASYPGALAVITHDATFAGESLHETWTLREQAVIEERAGATRSGNDVPTAVTAGIEKSSPVTIAPRRAHDSLLPARRPFPMRRAREGAHLTIYKKVFDSPETAQKHLDSIQKTMEKGIKSEVRGQKVEVKSSYEAVEGVGDKAIWSAKHNELSIAEGKRLYHVGARGRDKSQNKELSRKLALAILDGI